MGPRLNTETTRQERHKRRNSGDDDDDNGDYGDVNGYGVLVSQRQRFRTVQLKQKQIPEKKSLSVV